MPPQQSDRLLDSFDDGLTFGAHENRPTTIWVVGKDVATGGCRSNLRRSIETATGADLSIRIGRDADRPAVRIGDSDDGVIIGRSRARLECLEDDVRRAGSGSHSGSRI